MNGTAVDAIVEWFNPDKGFGFVEIADGSGDAPPCTQRNREF